MVVDKMVTPGIKQVQETKLEAGVSQDAVRIANMPASNAVGGGRRFREGFTLIELMIVVVIIAILATLAVPSYQSYVKRSRFVEVMHQGESRKALVSACITVNLGNMTTCDNNSASIGPAITNASTYHASTTVNDATITSSATTKGGLEGGVFVLTPSYGSGKGISWTISGNCTDLQLC